jgi:hypothetical protein
VTIRPFTPPLPDSPRSGSKARSTRDHGARLRRSAVRRPDSSGPRRAARRCSVTGQLHRLSRRPIEGRPSAFRFGRSRERDSVEKSARQRCMSQPLGYRRPSAMAGRNRRLSIDGSGGPTDTRYRRLERSAPGGRCRRNSVPHSAQGSRHWSPRADKRLAMRFQLFRCVPSKF